MTEATFALCVWLCLILLAMVTLSLWQKLLARRERRALERYAQTNGHAPGLRLAEHERDRVES